MLGFSIGDWWRSATRELANYYNQMDTTQWGVLAGLFVLAGFLLLKSSPQRR